MQMLGRFQPQKFSANLFKNYINISDVYNRPPEKQFTELEEFYNMTNKDVFKKYGIDAQDPSEKMLLANSLLLDSLLKDRYDEIETIFCGRLDNNVYKMLIHMQDGTDIIAGDTNDDKGIRIEKDGKKLRLEYDPLSKIKPTAPITDIDNLTIENPKYIGDKELIADLEHAVQEQFGIRIAEIANRPNKISDSINEDIE